MRQNNINITVIQKLNFRLIRALKYLERFDIKIKYKLKKVNVIFNLFSRLITRLYRVKNNKFILDVIEDFSIDIITLSETFRELLLKDY